MSHGNIGSQKLTIVFYKPINFTLGGLRKGGGVISRDGQ